MQLSFSIVSSNYRTNNFYHNEFYNFLENSFTKLGAKFALNMLFKFELLAKMHHLTNKVLQNHVVLSGFHSESMLCCFKRIIKLIERLIVTYNAINW